MSFCDGARAKVTAPAGGWWLAAGNSRGAAFAALIDKILEAAKSAGFQCEGRECRGDLHALCRPDVKITPWYATTRGKKAVVCLHRGDAVMKCRCYKPPAKKKQGQSSSA